MDANSAPATPVDLRRLFLWTHLFRAFRIALDIRKAILAAIALLLIAKGDEFILSLPFAEDYPAALRQKDWPSDDAEPLSEPPAQNLSGAGKSIALNARLLFRPLSTFAEPARVLLSPHATFTQGMTAWTVLIWSMLVWGFFGGAITRMAAVEFARDERHSLRRSLRFAGGKILSFLGAPLLPIGGIALFWVFSWLFGLIGLIPGVGEIVVGATFVIPLIFGLVIGLILLAIAVGWPLMYAAISTEGSDGFDGFSRTFSYVFGRPWHYLWYGLVAMAYGFVVVCFVLLVSVSAVYLAGRSLETGLGFDRVVRLMSGNPNLTGGAGLLAPLRSVSGDGLGSSLAGFWLQLLAMLIAGFVYSYFWCASTITYFLLRKVDDATALDEVYLATEDEEDELLPLVGVAASDQPVIERPANVDGMNQKAQPPASADDSPPQET